MRLDDVSEIKCDCGSNRVHQSAMRGPHPQWATGKKCNVKGSHSHCTCMNCGKVWVEKKEEVETCP